MKIVEVRFVRSFPLPLERELEGEALRRIKESLNSVVNFESDDKNYQPYKSATQQK